MVLKFVVELMERPLAQRVIAFDQEGTIGTLGERLLVAILIDGADAKSLDVTCLDRLRPLPVFVGFNGATP